MGRFLVFCSVLQIGILVAALHNSNKSCVSIVNSRFPAGKPAKELHNYEIISFLAFQKASFFVKNEFISLCNPTASYQLTQMMKQCFKTALRQNVDCSAV